jgi:hypothetical protein
MMIQGSVGKGSPTPYLTDVLTKTVARHPMSRIDDLLPFAYVKTQALDRDAAREHRLQSTTGAAFLAARHKA